jgi:replicative DNA helicase
MRKQLNISDLINIDREYDIKMLNVLLTDQQFLNRIRKHIDGNLFDYNPHISFMLRVIKDDDGINNWDDLEFAIKHKLELSKADMQQLLDTVPQYKLESVGNTKIIEKTISMVFKQKQLIKIVKKLHEKANAGRIIQYEELEELVKIAKDVNDVEVVDLGNDDYSTLIKEYDDKISIGIDGLDITFNGGISRKDILVYIAPTGVGKTTCLVLAALGAMFDEKKCLHIFVEDEVVDIRRKYFAALTGIPINDINENISVIQARAKEYEPLMKNVKLVSTSGANVKISEIETFIDDYIEENGTVDVLILDYLDRVITDRKRGNKYEDQADVIKEIDRIAKKYNIAIVTAAQTNRGGINKDILHLDDIQGSIERVQQATHVVTIASPAAIRQVKAATIHVVKAREFNATGKVFTNILFDPNTLNVDCTDFITINEGLE